MKHQWLKQSDAAENIIVFFSGWGFDASIVQDLAIRKDTNVLFINDYRSLEYQLPNLEHYQHRYLIAWSFGVAAYSVWQNQTSTIHSQFDCTVAVNGSMIPINRKTGIPELVVKKTIDTLSVDSFQVFAQKCFAPTDNKINEHFIIDVNARKNELLEIQQRQYPENTLQWHKVWISSNDKIFPLRNLQYAWQDHGSRIEQIDASHAPFSYWGKWQDLIV